MPKKIPKNVVTLLCDTGGAVCYHSDYSAKSLSLKYETPFSSETVLFSVGCCRGISKRSCASWKMVWCGIRTFYLSWSMGNLFHQVAPSSLDSIFLIPRILSQISRFLTGIQKSSGAKIDLDFYRSRDGRYYWRNLKLGKNVLMYHGVTLGGTSLKPGKRHPTIEDEVLIGAGAKLFGPLTIGKCSQIGGGSVVIRDVPERSVVVGSLTLFAKWETNSTSKKNWIKLDFPTPFLERIEMLEKTVLLKNKN